MLDEDKFQTMMVLGFLFRRLGMSGKAAELYRALLADRPDDPAPLAPLAAADLAEGRAGEALGLLDRLEAGGPGNLPAAHWLMRAKALAALGRDGESSAMVKRFIEVRAAEAGEGGSREGGPSRVGPRGGDTREVGNR
jgi:hypothetical protein